MGLRLTSPDADFSAAAIGYAPPVLAGCQYWNFFGTGGDTERNLIVGKNDGSLIGTPVVDDYFATFRTGVNYVVTDVSDADELTFLIAARLTSFSSKWAYLIGNYAGSGAGQYGANLYLSASGLIVNGSGRTDGAEEVAVSPTGFAPTSGEWAFISVRMGVGVQKAVDHTHAALSIVFDGSEDYERVLSVNKFRIGSSGGFGFSPVVDADIAFAAIYSSLLTDGQIDECYERVQGYLANGSITV